jgi:hypothetical protein
MRKIIFALSIVFLVSSCNVKVSDGTSNILTQIQQSVEKQNKILIEQNQIASDRNTIANKHNEILEIVFKNKLDSANYEPFNINP